LPEKVSRGEWLNIGGQLMPKETVERLKDQIKKNKIKTWDGVHIFYEEEGKKYAEQKCKHALASLQEIHGISNKKIDPVFLGSLFHKTIATKEWITENIYASRKKDYTNPYRKLVYDTQAEMDAVTGNLHDNNFINQQKEELKEFKRQIKNLQKKIKLQ